MMAVARLLKCMAVFGLLAPGNEGDANMPEVAEELFPFEPLLLFKNAAVKSSAFCWRRLILHA